MKHIKKFNESTQNDLELIEDYFVEYFDKWLIPIDYDYDNLRPDLKEMYNGYHKIDRVSTSYFGTSGFPNGKSGYRLTIVFRSVKFEQIDIKEFKTDMFKYITRVCKLGYQYETYGDKNILYIAFFK